MRHYTRRHQTKIEDSRQLTSPDQLLEGMHIGVATVLDPSSRSLRAARALAAFAFSYGRQEDQGRLAAGRQAWQHRDPHGLLPEWHGVILSLKDGKGVWTDLEGTQRSEEDTDNYLDYINQDPDALPSVNSLISRYSRFDTIGLVAITADNREFGEEAGRWMPTVTLCLDKS